MADGRKGYIKSSVFRRLFIPYVLIIALFVVGFCGWYLYSWRANARAMARENCTQQANAFCTRLDRQLLTAQALCNAMNSSQSVRDLYQKVYVEDGTVNPMQLYQVMAELKRIRATAASLDVYAILLGFQGDQRLYTSGTVIGLGSPLEALNRTPWIGVSSVADMFHLQGETSIVLNKRFLIFAEAYVGQVGSSSKGVALVLMERSALDDALEDVSDGIGGVELCRRSEVLLSQGATEGEGEVLEVGSLLGGGLIYHLRLADGALDAALPAAALMPVAAMALLGALLVAVAYEYSRRRYRPIGVISSMVSGEGQSQREDDEMRGIVRGIADLIGERNGYRERMITISPYASQGALRQLLDGDVRRGQLDGLREEQFWELRRTYFAVGIVDIAMPGVVNAPQQRWLDARTLVAHACQSLADEERAVVCCPRDVSQLYVVVNSDDAGDMEALFYEMLPRATDALDDGAISVTIGVSAPRTELERLRDACDEAERALENMLTGGRGSIYFEERDAEAARRDFVFPRDAQKRIAQDIRDGDTADLDALLDEVWEANFHSAMLAPETVRQLVDELHSALSGALRDVSEQSPTHLRVERVREPATIEEIFDYYRGLLAEAVRTFQSEVAGDAGGVALEKEICDYINANLTNPDMSLSAVADHFGVSGKLVGNVCKRAFGKTYLQYVRDCQIQRAAELLQTTDLPLEEIANRCGFTNLLTFRRNFKAVMNMNPSDFRK